jgi:hypothetical protein
VCVCDLGAKEEIFFYQDQGTKIGNWRVNGDETEEEWSSSHHLVMGFVYINKLSN